jgi:hypothetical protein
VGLQVYVLLLQCKKKHYNRHVANKSLKVTVKFENLEMTILNKTYILEYVKQTFIFGQMFMVIQFKMFVVTGFRMFFILYPI